MMWAAMKATLVVVMFVLLVVLFVIVSKPLDERFGTAGPMTLGAAVGLGTVWWTVYRAERRRTS